MKKILVAIDGSEPSLRAGKYAIALAKGLGGDVALIHVVPPLFIPPEVPFSAGVILDESRKAGEALLERSAAELELAAAPKICVVGNPADQIAETAESQGFDLVVIGSKGRGAVSRMLVGSTTDRVVHLCQKPVLVVR